MPWKDGYTISDEVSIADHDVIWPHTHRCCVLITVDLSVASGPDGITAADLASPEAEFARHDGLERLLCALRRHGLRATFAVPAIIAKLLGPQLRAIAGEYHEVAAEGLRHEDVSALSYEEERERLNLTSQILGEVTGEHPLGWFSLPRPEDPFAGGTISRNTMDLLMEAGYQYMGNGLADDLPHYWVTDFASRRAMLTLPYYYHFDDQFFLMFPRKGTGLENADSLFRNWKAEFDAQYKRGRCFQMTLHPQGVGWCNRMALLEDMLGYIRSHPGVWNPTGSACARYWRDAHPADQTLQLEASIWRDYPGSLS